MGCLPSTAPNHQHRRQSPSLVYNTTHPSNQLTQLIIQNDGTVWTQPALRQYVDLQLQRGNQAPLLAYFAAGYSPLLTDIPFLHDYANQLLQNERLTEAIAPIRPLSPSIQVT